ncbi:tetratricopeptide repeat protein [Nocardia sp. CDC160]|nr:tetratricopeptide repeat protein [Nocardia sp. CDC160]MEC3918947.1 tetratricopeptide repeat protein [Nocardia sp. CDC160]
MCGSAPAPVSAMATTARDTGRSSASTGSTMSAGSTTRSGASRSGRSVRTGRSGSTGGSRGRLGAGMVKVPSVPRKDPSEAVLATAEVPENHRDCGKCGRPVGRSRNGQPGRTEGFCPHCGTHFSFTPKLSRGDIVGGQYEVLGPLAHGGLGWIYLAVDHKVDDRPVVLKGLLNTGDADAMRAAVAEKRFLAQVDHPNIVRIYNFAEDTGPDGKPVGYIVMEYVGGKSLKQLLREQRTADQQYLPPARAIAYILEMLPALEYLHERGLAYCDFKPDNVMQTEEQLKLIDLGAVIGLHDQTETIYGTPGYQAKEIADTGPTVASEVYTVGRTLAALIMRIPPLNGELGPLPGPDTEPLMARYESLYRFLVRATDIDPDARFTSMTEMSDQLTGILREILAIDDGRPRPGLSTRFGPPRAVFGVGDRVPEDPRAIITALPVPLVDPADSGAALLASTSAVTPEDLEREITAGLASVVTGREESVEIPLRLIRAALEFGDAEEALRRLDEVTDALSGDWRLTWFAGQARLLQRDYPAAAAEFDALYSALPGEAAPKLALAVTAELMAAVAAGALAPDGTPMSPTGIGSVPVLSGSATGQPGGTSTASRSEPVTANGNGAVSGAARGTSADPAPARERAARFYDMVWRTDRTFTSAAFGAARVRRAVDDRAGAVEVLDQVDAASAVHTEAGVTAVETLLAVEDPAQLTEQLVRDAGKRIDNLTVDSKRRAARARMGVLDAALRWLRLGRVPADHSPLLGVSLDQQGVRTGLERCYRDLAHETDDMWERIALVEQANAVRPRTVL